jgi:DNA-binding beta-propeller fold protein YncE
MRQLLFILFASLTASLLGCQETKFPVDSLPQGNANLNIGDTVYVQQNPVWTGFNHPQAIIVGNEPFIYVADTDNDRIVMLDLIGRVIGYSKTIKHPVSITEDKRLQLLVCAQFDTLLPGKSSPTTFGAVYRLDLVSGNHNIGSITPRRVFFEPSDSTRRYAGVASLYNNQYYVCRNGPKNEATRVDRDIAILLFSADDQLLSPVTTNFSPDGTGLLSLSTLSAIATIPTSRSVEFVFCQTGDHCLYKVQWIQLITEGQTTNFLSKFYPSVDGNIDILKINHFSQPAGVTIDPSGNLYVVDAAKDSLYRFSTRGAERYSFGGKGSGDRQFDQPYGVAFYNKTVYVADRGNNRIVRFKLSSDLQ